MIKKSRLINCINNNNNNNKYSILVYFLHNAIPLRRSHIGFFFTLGSFIWKTAVKTFCLISYGVEQYDSDEDKAIIILQIKKEQTFAIQLNLTWIWSFKTLDLFDSKKCNLPQKSHSINWATRLKYDFSQKSSWPQWPWHLLFQQLNWSTDSSEEAMTGFRDFCCTSRQALTSPGPDPDRAHPSLPQASSTDTSISSSRAYSRHS